MIIETCFNFFLFNKSGTNALNILITKVTPGALIRMNMIIESRIFCYKKCPFLF